MNRQEFYELIETIMTARNECKYVFGDYAYWNGKKFWRIEPMCRAENKLCTECIKDGTCRNLALKALCRMDRESK